MNLSIKSDSEHKDLFKEIEFLTNSAIISIDNIVIDEENSLATIPLERKDFKRKKVLFTEKQQLSSSRQTISNLTIKNVSDYEITDNLNLQSISILFGIKVQNKNIYISSAEERSGVTAFELSINVSSYDLELNDIF